MFAFQPLRQRALRAAAQSAPKLTAASTASRRSLHATSAWRKEKSSGTPLPDSPDHAGTFARTDSSVHVEYPEEADLPSSAPVQGRGGLHFKRTLASFSLEGKTGVVTGGARGLGLVMSQALVISGADVAIVDLNSMLSTQF